MAKFEYSHKDSGETFTAKYPFKYYPSLISRITGQPEIPEMHLNVNFQQQRSIYSNKRQIKFQNLFFYKVGDSDKDYLGLINLNLKFMYKCKLIKLVNFDVNPHITLQMQNLNEKLPFTASVNFGKYSASRVQHFDNNVEYGSYDLSKVLKSMLPYYRTGAKFKFSDGRSFKIRNTDIDILSKITLALNRIHGYEDNVKISTSIQTRIDLYEEFAKKFRLKISNDLNAKKAFIKAYKLNKPGKRNNSSSVKEYSEHHVLSGHELNSKLLEMNILNTENLINNGSDFYLQNLSTIRVSDIPKLKDHELFSKLIPYFSLESIFLPASNTNGKFDLKNSFKFIYTVGLSIAVAESLYIDLAFYTKASANTKIKKEHLNRFRINISV